MPFDWMFGGKKSKPAEAESDKEFARKSLEKILGLDKLTELQELIAQERAIPPKVAVIGKAGVGKTTTINNLFKVRWKTSPTIAGTRKAQTKDFDLSGGGSLTIVDMPGLGEDIDADAIHEKTYREVLPTVDVAVWVIQANAKDLAEDQRILQEVVLPGLKGRKGHLVVGLNQVDLIGPGEWNKRLNYPTPEQEKSIERRCSDIINKLSKITHIPSNKIIYYSAKQRYKLYDLLIGMIMAASDRGWKLPVQPANPFELADADVQDFVQTVSKNRRRAR